MKFLPTVFSLLLAGLAPCLGAEEWLDRLDETLTVSAFDDKVRLRLSGTIDIEGYLLQQPPPGLIYTSRDELFNPRLSLFFDGQIGPHVYLFAQMRVDRGFDPSDQPGQVRLDEYAIRFTPWEDGRLNIQVGQFATVVGTWVERHLSWDNPFINAPLPYENVTAILDSVAPASPAHFELEQAERYEYSPVVWGPVYATGFSVAGRVGKFEYAAEMKNASISSRVDLWPITQTNFSNPTFEGRIGWRPNPMWRFGVSASKGPYFQTSAGRTLPPGKNIGDYDEIVLGQDISFAWHHLQIWAEVYQARFEVPRVGNADTLAYYIEAKYKFAPQLYGALRWNQQFFSNVPDGEGGERPWSHDIWRVDAAVGYRFTPHTQLKLQYSFEHEKEGARDISQTLSAQFTLRF